MCINAFITMY